ncbi:MAG: hypothetical protein K2P14_11710 [Anaeroplasmataceae bacterium]|nr:hypothetical protein [Anaeroplasmataceae bacterium]
MSVNWNWKQKMGVMTLKQSTPNTKDVRLKICIYQANCLGALIREYKDTETKKDMYYFWGFWNDTEHLKRCLGIVKGYDNIYADDWQIIEKIKLNTYYKDCLKIADCFTKVGVKVELYYKEIK